MFCFVIGIQSETADQVQKALDILNQLGTSRVEMPNTGEPGTSPSFLQILNKTGQEGIYVSIQCIC